MQADIDRETAGLARIQAGQASGLAFDATVEGEAGRGFDARDVAVRRSRGVLPDREVGQAAKEAGDRPRKIR